MAKKPNEDLFAESTMSFGEHLEELRGSLARAMLGLLIGFLIGLLVAKYVVEFIQTPLKTALEEHYIKKAIDDLERDYDKENVPEELREFVRSQRFISDRMYLEASEFKRIEGILAKYQEQQATQTPGPTAEAETTPAETDADLGTANQPISARVLGKPIPPPTPVLVATRVWQPVNTVVKALNAQEAFMIWLKAAFVAGLIIASPYIFYQIWDFVAAGLYPHEKKYVHIYLPFSLALFLAGAATAFFFVFKYVLDFLFGFNQMMNIDPDPRISEWMGFVLVLPLGFGIAYQLPLVMLFLHRIGIFSIQAYLDKWRIAVLVIFILSMLLTPADPVSMLLMALPLTGLYFLGVAMCKWMPRNKNPFSEGYEP